MAGFVRVRSAGRGDPKHEFDASVDHVNAFPDRYKVLDDVPVASPRPPKFVTASRPASVKESEGTTEKEKADA